MEKDDAPASAGRDKRAILRGVVFDLDAQRFQEFQVLLTDLQFRVAGESSHKRSLVRILLTRSAHADGGFKNKEDIVAAFLDPGNNLSNLIGVCQRLVNRFPQLINCFNC